jgi:hypothetical protein
MTPAVFGKGESTVRLLPLLMLFSVLLVAPHRAFAQDGGFANDAGDDGGSACVDDGGDSCDAGMADAGVPLACDGGLCDTTNGASCSSAGRSVDASLIAVAVGGLVLVFARRRMSRRPPAMERSHE